MPGAAGRHAPRRRPRPVPARTRFPRPVLTPTPRPSPRSTGRLASVRFRQWLHRTVHFVVRRGHGKITRVVFRVGTKRIGQDTRAPWRIKRKAHRIARHRGKVGVRVVLQHDGHRVVRSSSGASAPAACADGGFRGTGDRGRQE